MWELYPGVHYGIHMANIVTLSGGRDSGSANCSQIRGRNTCLTPGAGNPHYATVWRAHTDNASLTSKSRKQRLLWRGPKAEASRATFPAISVSAGPIRLHKDVTAVFLKSATFNESSPGLRCLALDNNVNNNNLLKKSPEKNSECLLNVTKHEQSALSWQSKDFGNKINSWTASSYSWGRYLFLNIYSWLDHTLKVHF